MANGIATVGLEALRPTASPSRPPEGREAGRRFAEVFDRLDRPADHKGPAGPTMSDPGRSAEEGSGPRERPQATSGVQSDEAAKSGESDEDRSADDREGVGDAPFAVTDGDRPTPEAPVATDTGIGLLAAWPPGADRPSEEAGAVDVADDALASIPEDGLTGRTMPLGPQSAVMGEAGRTLVGAPWWPGATLPGSGQDAAAPLAMPDARGDGPDGTPERTGRMGAGLGSDGVQASGASVAEMAVSGAIPPKAGAARAALADFGTAGQPAPSPPGDGCPREGAAVQGLTPTSSGSLPAPLAAAPGSTGEAGAPPRGGAGREERETRGFPGLESAEADGSLRARGFVPKPLAAVPAMTTPLARKAGASWGEIGVPELAAPPAFHVPVGSVPFGTPSAEGAVARDVARQIAAQPGLVADGTAELRLAPEELGPLRLSVERGEDGLRLVIEAARPETADLLRRHVEALRQELRQEGLGTVGVSIGGGEARREGGAAPQRGQPGPDAGRPSIAGEGLAPAFAASPAPRGRGVGGHLDLRF